MFLRETRLLPNELKSKQIPGWGLILSISELYIDLKTSPWKKKQENKTKKKKQAQLSAVQLLS